MSKGWVFSLFWFFQCDVSFDLPRAEGVIKKKEEVRYRQYVGAPGDPINYSSLLWGYRGNRMHLDEEIHSGSEPIECMQCM